MVLFHSVTLNRISSYCLQGLYRFIPQIVHADVFLGLLGQCSLDETLALWLRTRCESGQKVAKANEWRENGVNSRLKIPKARILEVTTILGRRYSYHGPV